MVGEGLLDYNSAVARLQNLGWTDPDMTVLLAESRNKLQVREEKMITAAQRTKQAQQKQALKDIQDARKQIKALQHEARAVASVKTLQGWYVECLLSEEDFRAALTERGYVDRLIGEYLAEAKQKLEAQNVKAQKKGEPTCVNWQSVTPAS